jgi:hypothetical protein
VWAHRPVGSSLILGFFIDRVSHGGHGDKEEFVVIDPSFDTGLKTCFPKITKIAEAARQIPISQDRPLKGSLMTDVRSPHFSLAASLLPAIFRSP